MTSLRFSTKSRDFSSDFRSASSAPVRARGECFPKFLMVFGGPLVKAACVLPDGLFRRVARDRRELGVHVLDLAGGVRDHHHARPLLDRTRQDAQAAQRLRAVPMVIDDGGATRTFSPGLLL